MDRRRWPELKVLTIIILSLQLSIRKGECQLSNPLAHDDGMQEAIQSNKFLSRQATDDMQGYPNLDEEALANSQCPQRVELRWQAEVSSSIYATPLIADVNADGKLDIVVPSFVHYLEVLEGADGEKLPGWPAFHQSIVHASPLLYDIDKDGAREILLATYNGEILVFRSSGYLMPDKLVVPRLRVRKDWYVGLTPDHMDRSHPDVHDEGLTGLNNTTVHSDERASDNGHIGGDKNVPNTKLADEAAAKNKNLTHGSLITPSPIIKNESQKNDMSQLRIDETLPFDVSGANLGMAVLDLNRTDGTDLPANKTVLRRLLQSTGNDDSVNERESKDVKEHDSTSDNMAGTGAENQQESLDEAADASFNLFRDQDGDSLTDEYAYDYDDYVDETMWGDEEWHESRHEREEDFVNVDSHILCTPVIADIDKDGVDELVVAASYFYDREYYEKPEHAQELGKLDIGKYVAGSVTVFNLQTRQVKWSIHLDLSTDAVNFRAYIYSSPTVVDLDGDGYLDIIVGTSFGFVYALHHNGTVRVNFPLQMGEIQGQIVAADINDDGKVEIVTADTRGNVAAWDPNGKEIWEVHLKSLIAQGPTVGDVDGDGKTDVVVPTVSGNIYVLKGVDGTFVRHFPFRTHGRVMSPVLLVNLGRGSSPQTGLTLVTTSFDGYMYLIDGPTGCADAIDIGETSYSMVVADNVDGGDDLDLIVTTMNGNVYCFQTPASHHPLKAWPMQTQGRNVISARYQREGIYVVPSSRNFRDESGDGFWVVFKIVDQMSTLSGLEAPYNVTITLLVPGNYQSDRRIVRNLFYAQPGVYKIRLPCAPVRTAATVLLEMVDKHGFYYFDEFSLTFYMQYHRLLKWMVSLPLLGMFAALVLFQTQDAAPLPSFSTDKRHS